MKIATILLLVTLGLVCSAYAAPFTVQKQLDSLLHSASSSIQDYDDDHADAQVFGLLASLALPLVTEYGASLLKKVIPSTSIQDDDDFNADQIEKFLQSLQDQAETEGFMDSVTKALSGAKEIGIKYGPTALRFVNELVNGGAMDAQTKVFLQTLKHQAKIEGLGSILKRGKGLLKKYGPTVLSVANELINGGATDAQVEAFLQSFQDQAEMEGFWEEFKKYGSKALSGAKEFGKKYGPTALRLANELVNGGATNAQVEAFLQSFQDQAEMEGFWEEFKKYGSKALSGAKEIGKKYGPTALRFANELVNGEAQDDEDYNQ